MEAVGAPAPLISVRVTGLGRAHGIDEVVQVAVVPRAGEMVTWGPGKHGRVTDVWHDYEAGEVRVLIE